MEMLLSYNTESVLRIADGELRTRMWPVAL